MQRNNRKPTVCEYKIPGHWAASAQETRRQWWYKQKFWHAVHSRDVKHYNEGEMGSCWDAAMGLFVSVMPWGMSCRCTEGGLL